MHVNPFSLVWVALSRRPVSKAHVESVFYWFGFRRHAQGAGVGPQTRKQAMKGISCPCAE